MSFPGWLADASTNRYTKTYMKDYLDLSGNLIIRNGSIKTPMNTISFNDSTGFVNFGNVYFGSAMYIYNPTTSSNIDVVSYVNANDSNIASINSSISTANSGITSNTSAISTINGKIGTLGYDSIYDFTTVNNLFVNPGGTIQYEDAYGNHPDLIPAVISNTSNIASNTSSINTLNSQISTTNSNVTTLQTKTTNLSFSTPTTTISNTTALSTCNISSNLRVDGSILLNAGALTLTNSNLQKIQFLSTVSSDIQTQTSTLATKLTNVSFSTPTTTISNTTALSTCNISSNLRVDGSILLNAGALTLTNSNLQKIQFLSTVSSDIQTQTTSNGTSIGTLNTKTTNISYVSPTTTISGTTAMATSTVSTSLRLDGVLLTNGGLTTVSNNSLSKVRFLENATSDIQNQLNTMVSLSAANTFSNTNYFNGDVYFSNPVTFSNSINASNIFYSYYGTNAIGSSFQLVTTGNRSWSSGTPANGDNAYEISFCGPANSQGFCIQGGVTGTTSGVQANQKSCFGLYFRTFNSGNDPIRTPILYSTDTLLGAASNTLICPSSLRLDGSLKVGSSGGTTITNTQLSYLSSLSGNVQSALDSNTTSITSLTTKNTDISYVASPAVTSIANKLQTSVLAFSTSLNGISSTIFNYISGLTSDLATTLTSITNRQQIGSIMQHPKGNIGLPYLLANGAAVSRTTYSALFASYSTLYGAGDGSTTFNLPNFQACFLRSYGAGITIGSSTYTTAAVASGPQNDAIQGHNHSPPSGTYLNTSTQSTSTNGLASVAILKSSSNTLGNTGGVLNANSGSETLPCHAVIYTYVLAL